MDVGDQQYEIELEQSLDQRSLSNGDSSLVPVEFYLTKNFEVDDFRRASFPLKDEDMQNKLEEYHFLSKRKTCKISWMLVFR